MRTDLKLFARFAVDVRGAQDSIDFSACGQRNRSRDAGACALGRFHDIGSRTIENALIVAFEPDADLLTRLLRLLFLLWLVFLVLP